MDTARILVVCRTGNEDQPRQDGHFMQHLNQICSAMQLDVQCDFANETDPLGACNAQRYFRLWYKNPGTKLPQSASQTSSSGRRLRAGIWACFSRRVRWQLAPRRFR